MRALSTKPNISPPDSDFPYGRIKNRAGAVPGTRVDELVMGDIIQFFEKLMADAGVTPNGLPDNAYTGFQLNEALSKLFLPKKVVEIGDWDMDASQFKDVNHGIADYKKIRTISAIIIADDTINYFPIDTHQTLTGTTSGGITGFSSTAVTLFRVTGGFFDGVAYNATSFNRGFVTIEYQP